jgi:hypothetical protein
MEDWIGLAFFISLIIGVLIGLKLLSKPRSRTAEEFERNAAEGTTSIGASMNALHELMNPEAAKAKETITQMKEGRYLKKKREGKAGGSAETGSEEERETGDRQQATIDEQ